MLIDCSCGATNRIPGASMVRHRCGKCKHTFTPQELVKARQEPPPPKPTLEDMLSGGSLGHMFDVSGEPTHACNDDEECGWEGSAGDLENKRCPECGKKVHELE